MYGVYTYGIFGSESTKYTVVYGVYIRFWPTLLLCQGLCSFKPLCYKDSTTNSRHTMNKAFKLREAERKVQETYFIFLSGSGKVPEGANGGNA
jgi:hypothetical protein